MNFAAAVNLMLKGGKVALKLHGHGDWGTDNDGTHLSIKDNTVLYHSTAISGGFAVSNYLCVNDKAVQSLDWYEWKPVNANKKKAEELRKQAETLVKQAQDLEKSL